MRTLLAHAYDLDTKAEKVEVCEAGRSQAHKDTFKLLFYFQDVDHTHGVLLKVRRSLTQSKSLKFPTTSIPLEESSAPNARVPPRETPAQTTVKEEPLDDGAPLFIPDSDEEASSFHALSPPSDSEDVKQKPKVHVSYAGFTIFGKELVCVLEPTAEVVAANPSLFEVEDDDASRRERRQLQTHAKVNFEATPSSQRSQRQYGRGSSRDASRQATPLFRGMTPATEDGF